MTGRIPLHASVAVNLGSGACSALLQLACIPWWINHLGMERFGLFGIHVTITALVQIFDLGLSPAVTTRIAMVDSGAKVIFSAAMRVAMVISITISLLLCIAAPWIIAALGQHSLAYSETVNALRWSGLAASLQLPFNVGLAGLAGLEMHATSGILRLAISALANLGGLAALTLIAPRIDILLACQALTTALGVGAVWGTVAKHLQPSAEHLARGFHVLRSLLHFSVSMLAISTIGALAAYLDRIILGSTLTLERFGMYSLAATVAYSIRLVVTPLHSAIFSRFAAQIALPEQLQRTYFLASAVLAVAISPFLATMAVMPYTLLVAWTGNPELARSTAPILRWLGIGMALNGVMHVPFALLISRGATRVPLVASAIFLLAMLIGLLLIGGYRGGEGAAWIWAGCGAAYLLGAAPFAHRCLPQDANLRFFLISIGGGAAAVLAAIFVFAACPHPEARSPAIALLLVTGIAAMVFSATTAWCLLRKNYYGP